ncbi:MAG: hypothetical protein MUC87_13915 [Bacteroidia bacterium]|jgi:hypothetical protein|nr:hypothetical protein [Bacteroidia bacterium]
MVEPIIKSVLTGFGIYTIAMLWSKPFLPHTLKSKIEKFDSSACVLIPFTGLLYLVVWSVTIYFNYRNAETQDDIYSITNRLTGPLWYAAWLEPVLSLSSQILWFKKIRKNKLTRICIALTLIVPAESIIGCFISIHRDYVQSHWQVNYPQRIVAWIGEVGIFGVVSILFHWIRINYLKKSTADHNPASCRKE